MAEKRIVLDGQVIHGTDEAGVWRTNTLDGWADGPDSKGESVDIPYGHGEFLVPGWNAARLVTATGRVTAPSEEDAVRLKRRISSVLSSGRGDLVVDDGELELRATVVRNGKTRVERSGRIIRFQFLLKSPDPRRYGQAVSEVTGPPVEGGGMVFDLFAGGPYTEVSRNRLTNPSFETPGGVVEVRRNLTLNPSAAVDTSNSSPYTSTEAITRITGISDSPVPGVTTAFRTTIAAGLATPGIRFATGVSGNGNPVTASFWARRVSGSLSYSPAFSAVASGSAVTLPTGEWVRVSFTASPTSSQAINPGIRGNTTSAEENVIDVLAVMTEMTGAVEPYFDGSTPAAGDFTYMWTGTANASASQQRASGMATYGTNGANSIAYQTSTGARSGSKAARLLIKGTNATGVILGAADWKPAAPGEVWTGAGFIKQDAGPNTGRYAQTYVYFYNSTGGLISYHGSANTPTTGGYARPKVTTPPAPEGTARVRLAVNVYAAQPGDLFTLDDYYLDTTDGDYYSGDTPGTDEFVYTWAGDPHASESIKSTVDGAPGVLDFGEPGADGSVTFRNEGTADSAALLRVDGYAPGFTITELNTRNRLVYTGTIPTGSHVILNPKDGTVLLDGYADRSDLLTVREWTRTPGESESVFLFNTDGRNARLTVDGVSAWW